MQKLRKGKIYLFFICLLSLLYVSSCKTAQEENYGQLSTIVSQTESSTKSISSQTQPVFFIVYNNGPVGDGQRIFELRKDLSVVDSLVNSFDGGIGSIRANCRFISIFGGSYQINITMVDQKGNIIENKEIQFYNESPKYQYGYSISPDGNWVAIKEASGEWGQAATDAAFQDVAIVAVNSKTAETMKQLTEHGGAFVHHLTWSPDSNFLSYSDNDKNGANQVFIYDPHSGRKQQVTQFTDHKIIDELKWSNDSTTLAASVYDKQKTESGYVAINGKMVLISIPNQVVWSTELGSKVFNGFTFWWGSGNKILVYTQPDGPKMGTLYWYSSEQKVIEKKVELSDTKIRWTNYAFPITEDLTQVVLIGQYLYEYDSSSGEMSKIRSSSIDQTYNFGDYALLETSSGSIFTQGCD